MEEPKPYFPRATPVRAVQNTGKLADLHKIAAWVLENGGRAWIVNNDRVQGPEILHIHTTYGTPVSVLESNWVVMLGYGCFTVLNDETFNEKYIGREEMKTGDPRLDKENVHG